MTDLLEVNIKALRERVANDRRRHAENVRTDAFLYNGGTVLVLVFTSAAAFLDPAWLGSAAWLPRALAAAGALLVGLERALSFGQRWRFHLDQRAGYDTVLDMIDFLECVPDSDKPAHRRAIWESLRLARGREAGIPTGDGTLEPGRTV